MIIELRKSLKLNMFEEKFDLNFLQIGNEILNNFALKITLLHHFTLPKVKEQRNILIITCKLAYENVQRNMTLPKALRNYTQLTVFNFLI